MKEAIAKGPFQFIFADAAAAKTIEGVQLLEALAIGGILVMDDFTPKNIFRKNEEESLIMSGNVG
ncbi:hypothetical protein ABE61_07285 [Lysinibacillus sphaericus]|uniref:hypothetical protein n=1 Tax=Lysinibacillus sphaericus TaxID=1421 RepID=UPI0018CCF0F5|nr:hypothetical protein [Lysinibacillus sphaericus]MBG9453883.1 hypothetical protein [Lysinibacillus sphaericus]MBG9476353.1 hypothetical protein [Lysinibacillus sphaericus]MBG9591768.1 hypothetical protein [Lysinibacillus sphaericus]